MAAKPRLTDPQRRWLSRAAADRRGRVEWHSTHGLASANWERLMKRLCAAELMVEDAWGYEITDAGRAAI